MATSPAIKVNLQYVQTIGQQLGGIGQMRVLLACKIFHSTDNTFDYPEEEEFPNILMVQEIKGKTKKFIRNFSVKLCANDTYEVSFFNKHMQLVEKKENVYCDQLQDLVEKTINLQLSMVRVTFS
jgi:hypothetical protein